MQHCGVLILAAQHDWDLDDELSLDHCGFNPWKFIVVSSILEDKIRLRSRLFQFCSQLVQNSLKACFHYQLRWQLPLMQLFCRTLQCRYLLNHDILEPHVFEQIRSDCCIDDVMNILMLLHCLDSCHKLLQLLRRMKQCVHSSMQQRFQVLDQTCSLAKARLVTCANAVRSLCSTTSSEAMVLTMFLSLSTFFFKLWSSYA